MCSMDKIYTITSIHFYKEKLPGAPHKEWDAYWGGWFESLEEAKAALKNNVYGLWDNWAHYVVIERVGRFQIDLSFEEMWYKFSMPKNFISPDDDDKIKLKKCSKPKKLKRSFAFCGLC